MGISGKTAGGKKDQVSAEHPLTKEMYKYKNLSEMERTKGGTR